MTLSAGQARQQDRTRRIRHRSHPDGLEVVVLDPDPAASQLEGGLSEYGITVEVFDEPVRAVAAAALAPTALFVLSCRVSPHDLLCTTETVRQQLGIPVVLACDRWDADLVGPAVLAGARPLLGMPYMCADLIDLLDKEGIRPRTSSTSLRVKELEISTDARDTLVAGHHVDLSAVEFALLQALARDVDTPVSRTELEATLWSGKQESASGVTAAAKRLRRKLAAAGLADALQTVRGIGYRLDSAGCVRSEPSNETTRDSTSSTIPATSTAVRPTGSSILQSK